MPSENDRVARVRLGEIDLKLTLTPKFLSRSLGASVITPFLKAYSKKAEVEPPVTLEDVDTVRVDGLDADPSAIASELFPIAPFTWVVLTLKPGSAAAEKFDARGLKAALPSAPPVGQSAGRGDEAAATLDWRAAAAADFALTEEDMCGWTLEQPTARVEDSIGERAVGDSTSESYARAVAEATFTLPSAKEASSRAIVFFPKSFPPNGNLDLILILPPPNCHARHPLVLWPAWP